MLYIISLLESRGFKGPRHSISCMAFGIFTKILIKASNVENVMY